MTGAWTIAGAPAAAAPCLTHRPEVYYNMCITTFLSEEGEAMPVSVRLDRQTELLLRRISRTTGRSNSEVIRDAIRRLADEDSVKPAESVYEQIADVVGVARGGNRRYAARSEEVLRTLFARRRKIR